MRSRAPPATRSSALSGNAAGSTVPANERWITLYRPDSARAARRVASFASALRGRAFGPPVESAGRSIERDTSVSSTTTPRPAASPASDRSGRASRNATSTSTAARSPVRSERVEGLREGAIRR